ncbi:MAG: hypothetical protein WCS51_05405, partial [Bacilli bacterium]
GYISTKVINNKTHHYLQSRVDDKVRSIYIKEEDLSYYVDEINKRGLLITKIKRLESKYSLIKEELSTNQKSLTGFIMLKDKEVAYFSNGNLISIDEELAPLFIKRTHNLESFLSRRGMDCSRGNSLLLRRILRIDKTREEELSLHVYAATLTDFYWFKPKGSPLKYKDIVFKDDFFFDLSLSGEINYLKIKPFSNPQLTVIGSYEKAWKLKDNGWWLYKKENDKEKFSELFIYYLGKELNINMAVYSLDKGYIISKDFVKDTFFEPISAIVGEEINYSNIFNKLITINKDLGRDYILLLWFDALVFNYDRHNENYGVMRSVANGKILSLAPNFDNNNALIANGYKSINRETDGLIICFKNFLKENKVAYEEYKKMNLPILNKSIILKVIKKCPLKDNKVYLVDFLMNGYKELLKLRK